MDDIFKINIFIFWHVSLLMNLGRVGRMSECRVEGNERTAFRRPRRRSEMRCMQGLLEHFMMNGTRRTDRMESACAKNPAKLGNDVKVDPMGDVNSFSMAHWVIAH